MVGIQAQLWHRTRVVTRVSRGLTLIALAAVAGALVVGWFVAAGVAVAVYVALGGRVAGRAPTWHVFMVAAAMLVGCAAVAFLALSGEQAEWYAVAFLAAGVAAAVAAARA